MLLSPSHILPYTMCPVFVSLVDHFVPIGKCSPGSREAGIEVPYVDNTTTEGTRISYLLVQQSATEPDQVLKGAKEKELVQTCILAADVFKTRRSGVLYFGGRLSSPCVFPQADEEGSSVYSPRFEATPYFLCFAAVATHQNAASACSCNCFLFFVSRPSVRPFVFSFLFLWSSHLTFSAFVSCHVAPPPCAPRTTTNDGKTTNYVRQHHQVFLQAAPGEADLDLASALEFINTLGYTSAFQQLRTREQLGYMVYTQLERGPSGRVTPPSGGDVSGEGMHPGGPLAWSVVVQSPDKTPAELEERVEAWIASFRDELVELTDEVFESTVASMVGGRGGRRLFFGWGGREREGGTSFLMMARQKMKH